MKVFSFKRKNKEGKVVEQPVSQEEFETLEANSTTLASILELFGAEATQEGFDVVAHVQSMIDGVEAITEAFGDEAEADDFDAVERITELRAESDELAAIAGLVKAAKGTTTLEKVKAIKPAGKTVPARGTNKPESTDTPTGVKRFQDYEHNKAVIKELEQIGVRLDSVDYSSIN